MVFIILVDSAHCIANSVHEPWLQNVGISGVGIALLFYTPATTVAHWWCKCKTDLHGGKVERLFCEKNLLCFVYFFFPPVIKITNNPLQSTENMPW